MSVSGPPLSIAREMTPKTENVISQVKHYLCPHSPDGTALDYELKDQVAAMATSQRTKMRREAGQPDDGKIITTVDSTSKPGQYYYKLVPGPAEEDSFQASSSQPQALPTSSANQRSKKHADRSVRLQNYINAWSNRLSAIKARVKGVKITDYNQTYNLPYLEQQAKTLHNLLSSSRRASVDEKYPIPKGFRPSAEEKATQVIIG